jgi:hypothetical protein
VSKIGTKLAPAVYEAFTASGADKFSWARAMTSTRTVRFSRPRKPAEPPSLTADGADRARRGHRQVVDLARGRRLSEPGIRARGLAAAEQQAFESIHWSSNMTATIIPFPLVRRRAYISKQAEQMACMSDVSAARYLQHQLQVQREAMRRRGVADELADRELQAMEAAILREFLKTTGAA